MCKTVLSVKVMVLLEKKKKFDRSKRKKKLFNKPTTAILITNIGEAPNVA